MRETEEHRRDAYRYAYNAMFKPVPLALKLLYRMPLALASILLAILLTIVVPLLAGWSFLSMLASLMLAPDQIGLSLQMLPLPPDYFRLWAIGVIAIVGIVAGGVLIGIIWAETFRTVRRFFAFLRGH